MSDLEGRYHGRIRPFDLFWDDAEGGYRRRFEEAHARTVWDEARAYSATEVIAMLTGSIWRRTTVANAPLDA